MGTLMENNSARSVDLIERARAGDREALNSLLARHRHRLRRMVEIHLDTSLQARRDASDGTRLVSGSGDSTVRIWDSVPPAVRARRNDSQTPHGDARDP
jgi:hypothetical protein